MLLAVNLVLLYVVDGLAFYAGRPMMTFGGLVPLILVNLVLMVITAAVSTRGRLNAGSAVAVLAAVTFGTVWLVGHNSGHNAYLASHLVSVTVAPGDQLPASSTDHMVIVSPDIATTKASQAMATGVAGQRNYSTYLQLGPATLQYVDGRMWYVFPLEFDGAGNKARLHAIEPGYIMVSAEDPNAIPVEHYDGALLHGRQPRRRAGQRTGPVGLQPRLQRIPAGRPHAGDQRPGPALITRSHCYRPGWAGRSSPRWASW